MKESSVLASGRFCLCGRPKLGRGTKPADELNERVGRVVAVALKVDVPTSFSSGYDTVAVTTGSLDLFVANAGVLWLEA